MSSGRLRRSGTIRAVRLVAVAAAFALLLASCRYEAMARGARDRGEPVPWWCTATEETPVTFGPAMGTVDWYAGTHKGPLSWDDCLAVSAIFDEAREWVEQWPTAADAEADGWAQVTRFFGGMGTHHTRGGITPELLTDPAFDRLDPDLDAAGLDDVFEPTRPDVLQFDGDGPEARLVGFDYYVRTDTGLPPEGLPGGNDWWHHHPWICHRLSDGAQIGFNTSDATCAAGGGTNVDMSDFYMLHVWVLDEMVFTPDVFAGMMPCITDAGAIYDTSHPCHVSRTWAGAHPGGGAHAHHDGGAPG